MKRTLYIILLAAINIVFTYLLTIRSILWYGLIVGTQGEDQAVIIDKSILNELLPLFVLLLLITVGLNLLITFKLLLSKHPIKLSLGLPLVGIAVCLPFFIYARISFFEYQKSTTNLSHYISFHKDIDSIGIVASSDTFLVNDIYDFTRELYKAKKCLPRKYGKNTRIVFYNKGKENDTLRTNGKVFGPFKGNYFMADTNLITEYLEQKSNSKESTNNILRGNSKLTASFSVSYKSTKTFEDFEEQGPTIIEIDKFDNYSVINVNTILLSAVYNGSCEQKQDSIIAYYWTDSATCVPAEGPSIISYTVRTTDFNHVKLTRVKTNAPMVSSCD